MLLDFWNYTAIIVISNSYTSTCYLQKIDYIIIDYFKIPDCNYETAFALKCFMLFQTSFVINRIQKYFFQTIIVIELIKIIKT